MKFATTNEGKLLEARRITGIIFEQVKLELPEPQAIAVRDVVREKARAAFEALGEPVLIEDTGLAFDAWNGLPGALVKWFLDAVGKEGVLRMLSAEKNRAASAVTRLCWYDGAVFHEFEGVTRGSIPLEPRGMGGFGWDQIFIPEGASMAFGEMNGEEKDKLSMRARAFEAMAAGREAER